MDIDLDKKLYNDYLNGKIEAYEMLYLKYKDKIRFFIFNIIKDYEKSEDITQDVFIYILKNKFREEGSFKQYIYLIAKSKALSYLNTEKRRKNITEKYLESEKSENEKDALEIIAKNEEKQELLQAISLLDEKYKNVMHLAKIEEFSYQETAEILDISIQDVKNYIHRGKKELRKILIKKGFNEMNKFSKVLVILIFLFVALSGIVYATIKIYENMTGQANMTPVLTGKIGNTDYNSIWVGSFNLVWNELMNQFTNGKVEFEVGNTELVDELNKQTFKKDQLSEEDYYIKVGKTSPKLKDEILKDIKDKFDIDTSSLLQDLDFNPSTTDDFTIYSMIYKNFEFYNPFDRIESGKFANSEAEVKYFGINNASKELANTNVKILFYNNKNDFAIKLETKDNEELILYRTDESKSFNEYYQDVNTKKVNYTGKNQFGKNDELRIPYINVNTVINYDELCGKFIKGTNGMYLQKAMQNIKFILNENGGNMTSEAVIIGSYNSVPLGDTPIHFYFDNTFVLFMKETNKEQPYMSLKVDNTDILVSADEI